MTKPPALSGSPIRPIPEHEAIVCSDEANILVAGRPGRGKTTVALRYAQVQVERGRVKPHQQILFLTFSRNAVYQIDHAGSKLLQPEIRPRVRVNTYHSFMWWLIQQFGRFDGLPARLDLMSESRSWSCREAARRSGVASTETSRHIAVRYSAVHFDDFLPLALRLVRNSKKLRAVLRERFPVIVVDEFQDTNAQQLEFIDRISHGTRLLCLADPDQQILRHLGASAEGLHWVRKARHATEYPLQKECLRTGEHDLLDFAEAILDGTLPDAVTRKRYRERFLRKYPAIPAVGVFAKYAIADFQRHYQRLDVHDAFPSVAIASFSNMDALNLQRALGRPTKMAAMTYRCGLVADRGIDVVSEYLLHSALWIATGDRLHLEDTLQILAGLLPPGELQPGKAAADLLSPSAVLDGNVTARGVAKRIVGALLDARLGQDSSGLDALSKAASVFCELRHRSAKVRDAASEEDIQSAIQQLASTQASAHRPTAEAELRHIKTEFARKGLRECVVEKLVPARGLVSSTLHKLKGKEFDYVCIVTRRDDKLTGSNGTETDARRLLYVALTRPRYDARILLDGTAPCPLLVPFLS